MHDPSRAAPTLCRSNRATAARMSDFGRKKWTRYVLRATCYALRGRSLAQNRKEIPTNDPSAYGRTPNGQTFGCPAMFIALESWPV